MFSSRFNDGAPKGGGTGSLEPVLVDGLSTISSGGRLDGKECGTEPPLGKRAAIEKSQAGALAMITSVFAIVFTFIWHVTRYTKD